MKKYKFRLGTVLRVRKIEEDRAKAELLVANREVAEAEAVADERRRHLRSVPDLGSGSSEEFLASRDRVLVAAASASFAADAVAARRAAAAAKRARWAEAQMRVNALDRLDDRMRAAHGIDAARAEQNVIDDLVAARARREVR